MLNFIIKKKFLILLYLRKVVYKIRFTIGSLIIKIGILLKIKFLLTYNKKIPLNKIKKILLFRTDRIGDLILTTPAIANLRAYFKKAQIDIVINSYNKPLLENNPYIDKIILKNKYSKKKIITILKKKKYDLAIIFFSIIKDKKIAFSARIPFRIGSNRDGGGFLLTHYIRDTREDLVHEVNACFDIIKILNIPIKSKQLILKPNKKYKVNIQKFNKNFKIKNKKYIIVHPYSRDPKMRWTEQYFKELIQKLVYLKQYKIVLIGSPKEYQPSINIIKEISPSPINAVGRFTLGQLIYFIKNAKLFIGNSTGTMHIANALNVPVIVVFGSRYIRHHYQRWYPWNPNGYYFTAKKICKDCIPWSCNMECMYTITPDMLYKKACKLIK